jgi:tyrosyl-tRNA synthetase
VVIDADVEMGGSDQLFNNLVGREFQQEEGKDGQVVVVTPLLVGTDGVDKMSKSKKNYIAVTDSPGGQTGMFGKVMRLPDHLMESYYTLLTDVSPEEFKPLIQASPREAKVGLAKRIISWLHNAEAATAAEQEWDRIQKGDGIPDDTPDISVGAEPHKPAQLLVRAGLASSNSDAIRKIKEGAVKLDGQKLTNFQKEITIGQPVVIQLGRRYARLKP